MEDLIEGSQNGCSARRGAGTPIVVLRLADVTIEGAVAAEGLREIALPEADRKKYALLRGDLLAFRVNGSPHITGQVICYPGPDGFAYCDHFIRFRLYEQTLLPALAMYAFRAWPARDQVISGMVSTAGQNTVSQKTYGGVTLFLPPFAEQSRIVEAIESYFSRLDDAVATLERVERNLKRYRASVLKAAVEGRLVPTEAALARQEGRDYEPASVLLERILTERRRRWSESGKKGKYHEPTPPDTTNLPKLPEGWCWASAEQVSEFITKGTTPSPDELFSGSGDVPFIKVYNLTLSGLLDFSISPTFISMDTHQRELARSAVHPGDVLMNIVGPPLGKVSIVPHTFPEWNINQAVARYRPIAGLEVAFLAIILRSEPMLAIAKRQAKATSGQFNLTLEICRRLPIPLPPLSEQSRIVAATSLIESSCDTAAATVGIDMARCARLRQSILKWAFEGKLADQDPSDEPASVLLERIKAERATATPVKPPKRGAVNKKARA